MSDVAITGVGAVTSVGMTAATSCASIRAGLSRAVPLDYGMALDISAYEEVPIMGHPAGTVGRGFSNVGRWLQLAPPALSDLCSSAMVPTPAVSPDFWADTACFVVLPVLGDRFLPDVNCCDDTIESAFVLPLLDRVRIFFKPARTAILANGRIGVLESFLLARDILARHLNSHVVVLVVDSLVDIAALQWLEDLDRLKSDVNPVGLVPGEAACAFLLEAPSSVTARAVRPLAALQAVSIGRESTTFLSGEISQGEALATVISTALSQTRSHRTYMGPVVSDLNGESWRAHEFGMARSRVPRSLWESDTMILPVHSTGDAGAATIGVQVAFACTALLRGYAGADSLLTTCSDEEGHVGAAVLCQQSATRHAKV
jgi:3-oxoacyl-[acyl-carrier-protein] synthase-1